MQKGQYSAVFKLVQGGIFASIMLIIVWGALTWINTIQPKSGVLDISVELMQSAYSARDTSQSFSREAKLKEEFFTDGTVHQKAGIPSSVSIDFYCDEGYCPDCGGVCNELLLERGGNIHVCAVCDNVLCEIHLGKTSC